MLLGIMTQTSGTVSYFGKEFTQHREEILSKINFASAYSHLQSRITVRQNLTIMAGLYDIRDPNKRIDELLDLLEVRDLVDKLYWHLSSGQKTRVVLVKALLNKPRLILMDEPTASLDPEIAQKVVELIRTLRQKENVAILYTSHNMAEVEELCDRVMIMDKGRIVAEDTPLELTKKIGTARLIVTFDAKQEIVGKYLTEKDYIHSFPRDHVVSIEVSEQDIPKVLFGLGENGVWITEVDIKKPNLEDVFLAIAGGTYEHKAD
ncbi:MAG: ABC transporter, ATPase subunit [Candidatus Gottesmanbacteria bacterium GW2011_GWB1_43_11]|uniref:ABC transporter, ATPase subunit n=1 Tax=Candidatus Gottesmanbacteria bacterium GW2011_GWB1_43_11 TaxID=1618446 RepID=A0A0G1CG22_9BACT|nr:MAG: ABC transporter, ATPase subunit [Candidatus Gottesmanbacteria bacterium GW2011_GWB1_43_11]